MHTIDPFVRAALVGTSRDAGAGSLTNMPVDQLASGHTERDFLLRAGTRDVYLRAGFRPPHVSASVEAAPSETLRSCSPPLAELLGDAFREGDAEVLRAVLLELGEAGLHLPHPLLPDLLAVRDRRLRLAALPVLGERGRWLARLNSAWSWALEAPASSDTVAQWEEGSEEQQVEALRAMRAADPADARARLAERLPKERAEQRVALLAVLRAGLSPDDEALLESALDDRSIGVKALAAHLLARVPESAYSARMQARAEAAVRRAPQESSLRGKVKAIGVLKSAPTLLVEPPVELDASAQRDMVIPKAQQGGMRAVALTHIVAAVPLESWIARFEMTPEQLVAHAGDTDWAAALIEGWALAAVREHNPRWARVLVRAVDRAELALTAEQRMHLARALDPADVIELVTTVDPGSDAWPLPSLLELVPRPWPREFAKTWLSRMRAAAASTDTRLSFAIVATVEIAARALPAELFESATAEWTINNESWQLAEWHRRIHKLNHIIRIRKAIAEERQP